MDNEAKKLAPSGILLVTKRIAERPSGGRELLCKLNRDSLSDIFGDCFQVLELLSPPIDSLRDILGAFRGHIDGVNDAVIRTAIEMIENKNLDCVFVDGSNLGEVVAGIRRGAPNVKIATFFHNVESRFFLGALKASRTPRALAVLVANHLAERKAVRHSDALIALTRHDGESFRKIYGRPATHISALSLDDRSVPANLNQRASPSPTMQPYLLFVGGGFYANRVGIGWFIENVAPKLKLRTVVVGRGLERLRGQHTASDNVEIVGAVEHLEEWYQNAHCVIAPIFDGSGMKTKVAEAMMFGKKVIGTPEAFVGYEDVAESVGWVCSTADDFVAAIEHSQKVVSSSFDSSLRTLFDRNYSYAAARYRLASILEDLLKTKLSVMDLTPTLGSTLAERGENRKLPKT